MNYHAWDSAAYEAERASAIARGHDFQRWHCDNNRHVDAWKRSDAYAKRPFRFEDLNGAPEPAKWGPTYPKTASAAVEKFRALSRGRELSPDETRAYGAAVDAWIRALNAPKRAPDTLPTKSNCASGQATTFSAAKHRAKIKAEFQADAARDRREWALGQSKNQRGETIGEAYKRVMREKRARELAFVETRAARVLEAA